MPTKFSSPGISDMLVNFKITDFIGAMLEMISVLLGRDNKNTEASYFARIANWFLGT